MNNVLQMNCEIHPERAITHYNPQKNGRQLKRLLCADCLLYQENWNRQNFKPKEDLIPLIQTNNTLVNNLIKENDKHYEKFRNLFQQMQSKIKQIYLIDEAKISELNYQQLNNLLNTILTFEEYNEIQKCNFNFSNCIQQIQHINEYFIDIQCTYQSMPNTQNVQQQNKVLPQQTQNQLKILQEQNTFLQSTLTQCQQQQHGQIQQLIENLGCMAAQMTLTNQNDQQDIVTSLLQTIEIKELEFQQKNNEVLTLRNQVAQLQNTQQICCKSQNNCPHQS